MKVFALFQTDVHRTRSSRVFFGVFDSFDAANQAAKDNDLYDYRSEIVIVEAELNQFNEL